MTELTLEFEFRNQRFKDAAKGLQAFGLAVKTEFDRLPPVMKNGLRQFLDSVALALSRRHGNPWPGGTTASSLSRRSGALVDSIKNSVQVYGTTLADISGTIGSNVAYARIQETGGVIRPVRSKYLTVPLPAALNSDGTPKYRSARDWKNTFFLRSKAGNLLIVQRVGADLVPLYVLKTEVTIPPRMKMLETLKTGLPYFVEQTMERMLAEVQKGLTSGNG